jgi:hypothetical protein
MVAPISRLLIHAPIMPRQNAEAGGFDECLEQFAWYLDGPAVAHGVGSIASMPYADEAYAFIPTIDVRFVTLTVPLVSRKKLQTVLPTLLEDQLLSVQNIYPQVFAPLVGQSASLRTVAVMHQGWHDWMSVQVEALLAASVMVLADCFIVPPPQDDGVTHAFTLMVSPQTVMYVMRTGAQTGLAWLEEGNATALQGQNKSRAWDWAWVRQVVLDEKTVFQTKLITSQKRRTRLTKGSVRGSWSALLQKTIPWINASLGVALLSFALYGLSLILLNWKWQVDMRTLASTALQSVPAQSTPPGAQPLVQLIAYTNRVQHRQGQLTSSDFLSLAAQLQQLRAQLPADAISEIDYQGSNLLVRLRSGIDPTLVMQKANDLGMAIEPLGESRYRVLAYAGLGDERVLVSKGPTP